MTTPASKGTGARKISDLTHPELEKLHAFFCELFTELKKEWESRPENKGKTVTYRELWDEYVAETGGDEADRGGEAQ